MTSKINTHNLDQISAFHYAIIQLELAGAQYLASILRSLMSDVLKNNQEIQK